MVKLKADLSLLRRKAEDAYKNPVSMSSETPEGWAFLPSREMKEFLDVVSPSTVIGLLDSVRELRRSEEKNPTLADGSTLFDSYAVAAVGGLLASTGRVTWTVEGKTVGQGSEYMTLAMNMASHALIERQKALQRLEGGGEGEE